MILPSDLNAWNSLNHPHVEVLVLRSADSRAMETVCKMANVTRMANLEHLHLEFDLRGWYDWSSLGLGGSLSDEPPPLADIHRFTRLEQIHVVTESCIKNYGPLDAHRIAIVARVPLIEHYESCGLLHYRHVIVTDPLDYSSE
jgi:hypothetical protein